MKPAPRTRFLTVPAAPNLNGLVNEKAIAPHIPVIDKSNRQDGTFSREDFSYDKERDIYICPAGKTLKTTGTLVNDGATLLYRASTHDCRPCPFKSKCCAKVSLRKVPRDIHEAARDVARAIARTEDYVQTRRDRKKVEMLFAHLKRTLRLNRLRLRGPRGAQFEFTLAAIAQNLRRLAKLTCRPPPRNLWTQCIACTRGARLKKQQQALLLGDKALRKYLAHDR
jgi:hypothetical protein